MKLRLLLFSLITLLTFSNSVLFSQTNAISKNNFNVVDVLSVDSLLGFDEGFANQQALNEGYFGEDFKKAMAFYRRQFVIEKYDLYAKYNDPQLYNTSFQTTGKYGVGLIANAPCTNEDFESGTLAGWTASTGINSNSQNYPATPTGIVLGTALAIVNTPIVDPFVGAIPNSPLGGSKVIRINNSATGAVVVKLTQTFSVTPTNYLYDFAYWAVMQDAGAGHTCSNTPYMLIKIRDNFGNLQGCPNFSIVAPATGGCTGIGPLTWLTVGTGINTVKTSASWQKFSIDLTNYITSPLSNVSIEVIVGDCSLGGHFGYAYFDSNCNTMNLTVNSQTISMPSPTVYPQVLCGTSATLTAPSGLSPYLWNGPFGSGITSNTNQVITTSVPGNYTLAMNPTGICNPPITKIINLSFVPPTTVSASPANLCATGTNTSSTLSAAGAAQYTWMPGGSNLSSIVVTPTITTIYTVTARTGTCIGNFTVLVTVNPDPVVSILSSNASICPGQTATLTAFGANTYVWNPGAFTGTTIIVSPPATTIYTVVGTAITGCSGSATTSILLTTPQALTLTPLGSTFVCSGSPVSFVAGGASNFTWMPNNVTGFFQTFTPTITTTYTVIGASGTCTNSAMVTASVDPGPSMTITPNPALVCPGNTTTLTVSAPTSLGFTWTPGGSNATSIVVTPTIAGGYSVTGVNLKGCFSTYTANPILSPVPVMTISPATPSVCFGSSVTLTASGGSTYTWNPGNITGASISAGPAATTIYTIIGSNGTCTSSINSTLTVVPLPLVGASSSTNAVCAGQSVNLLGSGATNYTWMPGGLIGSPVTVTPAITTVYTVTGNSGGCSNTATVSITVNNGPVISANASPAAICAGNSATLSSSGPGAISFTWSPGALPGGTVVVNPPATTLYSVTAANAFGCNTTNTVNVTVNLLPTIVLGPPTPTVCSGNNINLTAGGAITFTWMPGNLNGVSISLSPTSNVTYTVSGTSAAGCIGQNTITVVALPNPTINASASPSNICSGSCFTMNTLGAFTYTFLPATFCPVANTNYTVTGTGANGCPAAPVVVPVLVNSGPALTIAASPTSICAGGSSNLSSTGAVSYTWLPGNLPGANVTVSPGATTTYTVIGANAIGCTSSLTITVVVNSIPLVSASASPSAICLGGTSNLSGTGATSYTWMPGSLPGANVTVNPASTTIYTLTGSALGCTASAQTTVVVNPTPVITASANPAAICPGGSSTLTSTGALTYAWSTGGSGASISVSPALTTVYTVTGTSGGCNSIPVTVTVVVNPAPAVGASASPANICPGNSSNLSATGALTYTWLPGGMNGTPVTVTPLLTTLYTVTGSNAFGCTGTNTVLVVVSPAPAISASSLPGTICAGQSSSLTGTGASTYTWNPGNLNGSVVNVSPASTTIYTLNATTAAGCVGQATTQVIVLPTPVLTATILPNPICAGSCATLTAGGASTYTWLPVNTNGTIAIVCPTINTVYQLLGNSGGCTATLTLPALAVVPLPAISASASQTAICPGGSSNLSAIGAISYTWQPGNLSGANVTVNPAATTIYTVFGANASGCISSANQTVVVNPAPTVTTAASQSTVCAGQPVILSAFGATTYTWLPGGGTGSPITLFPASTTNYTVVGALGTCTGSATRLITVVSLPLVNATASPASICAGSCSTLTATGAASYTWSNGSNAASTNVCPLTSSTYTVIGSNGFCSSATIVAVTVNTIPTLSISASNNPICSGASATLQASGATSYTWNPGNIVSPAIVVNPATTTVYNLIGANGTGCSSTINYTFFVNPSPVINVVASSPSVCMGFTTGLFATGATNYTWYPGGLTTNPVILTPTSSTQYTVTGELGSCSSSTVINITVIPLPVITASANPANVCAGNSTTLTATGAITYTWLPGFSNGSTFIDTPVASMVYTVAGFAASGCPNFATVAVNVLPIPSVFAQSSSPSVCVGSSAVLSASGAVTYTWMPGGSTGPNILVNPASNTTYTVTGDNGAGCTATATVFLFVNPLPLVAASSSTNSLCEGSTVTLTATGANNYTWNPMGLTGAVITDNPLITTTYTLVGTDLNGCSNQSNITVNVNPNPTISVTPSTTNICVGSSASFLASGATTYVWSNGALVPNIVVSPTTTTTYSVIGTDSNGCSNLSTALAIVIATPTITVSPLNASVCIGSQATLTAFGATNYTWLPSGNLSSVTIESPLVYTTYTVIGDNGGICSSSFTVGVNVNPLPKNVLASEIGIISCANNTATLVGSSTSTNVTYVWTGPQGYTSASQNATVSSVWGTFTLTVTDNATGCSATDTTYVPTDNSIPLVIPISSGSITCAVSTVTLIAINSTTNPSYAWVGPGTFTSNIQNPTTIKAGNYTITVKDLTSGCTASAVITVGTHTRVSITASISPATCTEGISNNDGTIRVFGALTLDKYDLVSGASYTGTANYTTAIAIPFSGILTNNLANPTTTLAYTVRLFDAEGCTKDTTLFLVPSDCSLKTIGIAKAVSVPVLNAEGTYDVTYRVVVRNYGTSSLTAVNITDNLNATFPSPTSYTVVPPPVKSGTSGLVVNQNFDGAGQPNLTTGTLSTLAAGKSDTITFNLKVKTNSFFLLFKNTAMAEARNNLNQLIRDSSNTGLNPDPDNDGKPTNNNIPTAISFTPNVFFGITKVGEFTKIDDKSYDVSYTVTVHNLGNDTLTNVVLKDSLFGTTVKSPASYSMRSAPVASGALTANSLYDGNTNSDLIVPAQSKMPPKTVSTVRFIINVVTENEATLSNSAIGSALSATSATQKAPVFDISNSGTNPDSNGNGIWNETADNVPTVLILPATNTLFIPEGFSPNGDNINDYFVIKGLPLDVNSSLTIFNRWGNKIYSSTNYSEANPWDGTPNVSGTLGKDKLPSGTYYFILDMKGTGIKPITGFIVLQY